jgi:hypothetical protein
MVLTVKLDLMPSPKKSFQWETKESTAGASLETYAPDDLSVVSARLVLQEEIVLEWREAWGNGKKGFTKMDKDDYLKV